MISPTDEEKSQELAELMQQKNSNRNVNSVFSSVPTRPAIQTSSEKYKPIDWTSYFDEDDEIQIPNSNDVFHIYKAGTEGPVVFCLHGGGYSGEAFEYAVKTLAVTGQDQFDFGTLSICKVYSSNIMDNCINRHFRLSFALAASNIKQKARVVAIDLRGHGKSATEDEVDLSIESLCNDVLAVLEVLYGDFPPAIVLIGHSMGGSVAVNVAAKRALPSLCGLVVVDVVEGTAMASLTHMKNILSNRVQHFATIEKAIEWSIRVGSLRNVESGRVSIPGTLKYDESKECYVHRAKLDETDQYWRSWYEGLSDKFLSCPVPKLLLLAGPDRMDRALTIGQMQGKFHLVVVKCTGHAIQEDVPEEFAALVLNFISRNRIGPNGIEIPRILRPHSR